MVNVGKAVGYLDLDIDGFKKGLKTAKSDFAIFNDQTATTNQKLQGLSSGLTSVGGTMTKYVSTPLGVAGGLALKFATDFQSGMAKVSTIADTSVVSIKGLSKGVLDISNKVNISSTELSEALYQTISATGDTANALGYVEQASKLAKGGFTTVTQAVDGATSVLNAYGLSGIENFTKVSDVMVQTQNIGKTTVDQLAGSLYNVIPTAAALGVSFEQVGASLAAITAQGTPTATATTQLRQLFIELSKDGNKASDTFKQMSGQTFKDFIASGGTVSGALEIMQKAAQRNNVSLSDMFGSVEAGNAALQLTGVGAEKFDTALKGMEESAGATDEAFKKMMDTAGEKLGGTKISFINMLTELGDSALPLIGIIADALTNLFNAISALPDPIQAVIGVLGGLLIIAGPLLLIIGQIAGAILKISELGITWTAITTALNTALGALGSVLTTVGTVLTTVVLSPFTIILGLLYAFKLAVEESGMTLAQFKQDCANDMEEIKTFFVEGTKKILDVITNTIDGINTVMKAIKESVISVFSSMWTNVVEGFKTWKKDMVQGFNEMKSNIGESFKEWTQNFVQWGKDIPKNIWEGIKSLSNWLKESFNGFLHDIFGGSEAEIKATIKGESISSVKPSTPPSGNAPKGINTRQLEDRLDRLIQVTEDAPYRNQQLART